MTTAKHPEHVPYEDASTPAEMRADCEAARRNLPVPLPRRAEAVASTLVSAAPARLKAPVIAVTDRLARLAGSIVD